MVVATSAGQRQSEKRLSRGAYDVIELVVTVRRRISWFVVPMSQAKKTGGDHRLRTAVRQFIARDLLHDEAVEGLVRV